MLHRFRRPARSSAARGPARGVRATVGLSVAAIALLGTLGPGTAATWNSAAVLGSPVITAGTVTAELTGFSNLTQTFTTNKSTDTAYVRLRNGGDVPAEFSTTVTLAADSSQTLASLVRLTAWNVTSQAQCTPNASPVAPWTGLWTNVPSWTGRLQPGATVGYCIRTELDPRDLPSTAMSITPTLTATLYIPGTTWRSAGTATATQSVAG